MRGAKISLVIPHYPSEQTDIALAECLKSYTGHYDELMLVINDGIGYGPAVNWGLKWTTGDYIVVSNNDITLLEGSLRELAHPKRITIPIIEPPAKDSMPRAIFCMPRWAYRQITSCGFFYDPRFEVGYWEDDDLIRRLGSIKVATVERVKVNHFNGGGMTMKQFGEQEWHDKNAEVFKNKWS